MLNQAVRPGVRTVDRAELESLATELKRLLHRGRCKRKFIERARVVDSRLHDLVAVSCGNRFLVQELSRLKILFRAFRDMAWQYEESRSDYRRLAEEAGEHLAIVEALLAADSRAAARAMSRHIKSGIKYWSQALPSATAGKPLPEPPPLSKRNGHTLLRKNGK